MGEATSVAREPIPAGSNASRASQCEVVRVDENVAVNCWKDEASGGWLSEVMPSFFIITFCAWTTGFVARCRDFRAKRSLHLIVNSCCCGRDLRRGGEATNGSGGASVHTAHAKSIIASFVGISAPAKRWSGSVSHVPRATVTLRMSSGM